MGYLWSSDTFGRNGWGAMPLLYVDRAMNGSWAFNLGTKNGSLMIPNS